MVEEVLLSSSEEEKNYSEIDSEASNSMNHTKFIALAGRDFGESFNFDCQLNSTEHEKPNLN